MTTLDFEETLRSCPLLKMLTLFCVSIYPKEVRLGTEGAIELAHLESCTMMSLAIEVQCYLISLISLPRTCTLDNVMYGCDISSAYPSYANIAARWSNHLVAFERIHIATIYLYRSSVMLIGTPQDFPGRRTFELALVDVRHALAEEPWRGIMSCFNLDSVTSLQVDNDLDLPLHWAGASDVLTRILPHIRELTIRTNVLKSLLCGRLGAAMLAAPLKLETIRLHGMNVNADTDIGLQNVRAMCTFINRIQLEKPMLELVLLGCLVDEEGLGMLRTVPGGLSVSL